MNNLDAAIKGERKPVAFEPTAGVCVRQSCVCSHQALVEGLHSPAVLHLTDHSCEMPWLRAVLCDTKTRIQAVSTLSPKVSVITRKTTRSGITPSATDPPNPKILQQQCKHHVQDSGGWGRVPVWSQLSQPNKTLKHTFPATHSCVPPVPTPLSLRFSCPSFYITRTEYTRHVQHTHPSYT